MSSSTHPNRWLIAYNSISASLWSLILFNTLFLGAFLGQPSLFEHTATLTICIQCLAVVEIYNSAVGLVRSPIFTTATQVFSRLLVVIGIMYLLPESPANKSWAYITLCLSWSITEIIRYSYYAANLQGTGVPQWLTWLRYTTFYVLYPTGVSSEVSMIYLSLDAAAAKYGVAYAWILKALLLVYVPGFYMLYTYMIKQRKKVLGNTTKKSQ